ncbi:MAG TPA: hypothetical protein VFN59_04165 [Acidimicrobiales bacterium]|nr:hypothetical protein [Acidimicrobiales bacterium]
MADNTGRPEIFAVLGGSAVIGGIVIVAEKLSAHDYWPLLWGGLLIAPGVYFLLASFSEGMWVPGRRALRKRIEVERALREELEANRQKALDILTQYHSQSIIGAKGGRYTYEQFTQWFLDLGEFVAAAWGDHERSLLSSGDWSSLPSTCFSEVETRIMRLLERVSQLPLLPSFDPLEVPSPQSILGGHAQEDTQGLFGL